MPKVIRLKESDLNRIVKRVIKEGADGPEDAFISCLTKAGIKGVVSGNLPPACAAAAVNPKDEVAIGKCVDALLVRLLMVDPAVVVFLLIWDLGKDNETQEPFNRN